MNGAMHASDENFKRAPAEVVPPVASPRVLREVEAAEYVALSASYLRNQRAADMRSLAKGGAVIGPRWIHFGGAVRYVRDDLDAWIDEARSRFGKTEVTP